MKIIILALAFLFGGNSFASDADDIFRSRFYAATSGGDVWFGPGGYATGSSVANGSTFSGTSGGVNVVKSGPVALRDGRSAVLTATRKITTSSIAGGLAAFARGPYGIAAAVAIPFVVEWVAGDNQEHIRINPTATGFEKKDTLICSVAPCLEYGFYVASAWTWTGLTNAASVAPLLVTRLTQVNSNTTVVYKYISGNQWWLDYYWTATVAGCNCTGGDYRTTISVPISSRSTEPKPAGWLPASMDDIAPYLIPRVPSAALVPYLLERGIDMPAVPVSVTGPSPALEQLPVSIKTTTYAKPSDIVGPSVIVIGNPYGLPSNVEMQTKFVESLRPLSPSSITYSGPIPANPPIHSPVSTPVKEVTKSIYDPVTDKTTSVTTTSQDGAKQETTTTTTTNITNTTNSSKVTNLITNITNITNTTTNEPIGPPLEDIKNDPQPQPESDPRSECEKDPDVIGCAQFGTPTSDDPLKKETSPVTVTAMPFAGSAACPAALNFNVSGHAYAVSYQPMCDKLAILKYLFLAMAGFVAAWVVASTFKV